MKRTVAIAALLSCGSALLGCGGAKAPAPAQRPAGEPGVEYDAFDISERSFRGYELTVSFKLSNPTGGAISVTGGQAEATLDGQPLGAAAVTGGQQAAAGGAASVPVKVRVTFPEGEKERVAYFAKKTITLEVKGDLATSAGSFALSATVADIPLPVLPKVILAGSSISRDGESRYGLTFEIEVVNPNVFEFRVDRCDYEVSLEDKPVDKGTVLRGEKVPPNASQYLTVQPNFSPENIGKEAFTKVVSSNKLSYVLGGTLTFSGMSVPIAVDGVLNFARQQGSDDE